MNLIKTILYIMAILAGMAVMLYRLGWNSPRVGIFVGGVLLVGIIWGAMAILASSQHPPVWAQQAMPFIGGASALAFALLFVIFHFRRR